jgi:hypothetical protein
MLKRKKYMTDKLFFDTDCISAFLWVKEENILFKLYHELAFSPRKGEKIIGKGEAAAIALAKTYNGIIASNNLKDISKYVEKYGLEHVTTGDILVDALNKRYIDEETGNQIWNNMIRKQRMLPTATFSEYLKN